MHTMQAPIEVVLEWIDEQIERQEFLTSLA